MVEEQWKSYGKHYRVSSQGKIESKISGKQLNPSLGVKGYRQVVLLDKEGNKVNHYLHRLVAKLFLPIPDGMGAITKEIEVNHKDGNKDNNSIENLEYMSHVENMLHAWDTGLMSKDRVQILCVNTGDVFNSIEGAVKWCGLKSSCSIVNYLNSNGRRKSAGKHPKTKEALTWKRI